MIIRSTSTGARRSPARRRRHPGLSADAAERRHRPGQPKLLHRVHAVDLRRTPARSGSSSSPSPMAVRVTTWRGSRAIRSPRAACSSTADAGRLAGRHQVGLHRRHATAGRPSWPDDIFVVDLRTGARSVWPGGLSRPGQTLTIPGISWTPDGDRWSSARCGPAHPELRHLPRPDPASRGTAPRGPVPRRRNQERNARSRQRPAAQPVGPLPRHRERRAPGPGGQLHLAVLSGPADAATLTVERVERRREAARRALPVTRVRHRGAAGQRRPHPQRRRVHTC